MSYGIIWSLLAMVLFGLWLWATTTNYAAGGLVHVLLVMAVSIALLRLLAYQRRRR